MKRALIFLLLLFFLVFYGCDAQHPSESPITDSVALAAAAEDLIGSWSFQCYDGPSGDASQDRRKIELIRFEADGTGCVQKENGSQVSITWKPEGLTEGCLTVSTSYLSFQYDKDLQQLTVEVADDLVGVFQKLSDSPELTYTADDLLGLWSHTYFYTTDIDHETVYLDAQESVFLDGYPIDQLRLDKGGVGHVTLTNGEESAITWRIHREHADSIIICIKPEKTVFSSASCPLTFIRDSNDDQYLKLTREAYLFHASLEKDDDINVTP